ncbi:uncharacterized protein LOC109858217 [Pseudomyrmex gracilis]|uniref:uncharacterized protein LOC109858217 n=1 Tax=Pseudomyrmex gracilis TaxID=219809 RepID=UPI000995BE3E|nr:uncharacterized protein LOC109858217 [Pseudomyrmex gracilis]
MLRTLIFVALLLSSAAAASTGLTSYARVAKNGQLARSSHGGESFSWIGRPLTRNNTENVKDVIVTVAPVYVSPRTPKLRKGEAIDHTTMGQSPRYSTLDHEMITKLDARKQIQHRFHPPVNFPVRNGEQSANGKPPRLNTEYISSANSSVFPGPIFSGAFDNSYNVGPPSEFLDDEPPGSKPIFSKYPPEKDEEIPDSYKPPPNKYQTNGEEEDAMDYSGGFAPSSPSHENEEPPKTHVKYANHYNDQPTSTFDSYGHNHHDFHHDLVYDHVPEFHDYHHHPITTTEEPEMNDQRLDKRPYSYYFIGKKLWYIPLYFSIYFVIYIAALVLKSIARHKINLPTHLADVAHHQKRSEARWTWVETVLEGVERFAKTYGGRKTNVE